MKDEFKSAIAVLERRFQSPLSIREMSRIARGFESLSWTTGDSHYYGYHLDGRTNDGAWIRISDIATSDAIAQQAPPQGKSMEQWLGELGFDVEIFIPADHPDLATGAFLDFIGKKLLPELKATYPAEGN